jgi:hypothetical protein
MNILFLSPATQMDYQCDTLLIGLRQLYGDSVVDYPRIPYLYQDYGDTSALYGHGFSTTRILPSDMAVDRDDIPAKIAAHFYDLIIYGSVHRDHRWLDLVTARYRHHEVLFIDGEDQSYGLYSLCLRGLYFKRELYSPHEGVFPIFFGIPASKIGTLKSTPKTKVRALIDPRDRSTYIYTREADYYADYASSLFAITMKKGGWDTMRTLEIMANGCIPLFLDLDQCPPTTCVNLPKAALAEALTYFDRDGLYWDTDEGHAVWTSLWRRIHLPFVCRSTTERLAQYVIETQQREAAQ